MSTIAVIDYGMGNLRSVARALEHVAPRQRVRISNDPRALRDADRVVFPGQGAIRDCMAELSRYDLCGAIREAAAAKPFLGLCLGPQALLEHSEENGGVDALGILPGTVRRFPNPASRDDGQNGGRRFKVPHMGWSRVRQTAAHPLWQNVPQHSRFYFVHSYYLDPAPQLSVGRTDYLLDFTSVIARENIFAVQFHPEKSAATGLRLLENFCRWQP